MPRFGEREINKKRDREKEKERERNLVRASEHERWFCVECDERYSNARGEAEDASLRKTERHAERFMCGSVRVETTPHYHTLKMDWLERKTTREHARRVRTRRKN